ncbi:MAG: dTMP kinase [Actinomycetota bacterium]
MRNRRPTTDPGRDRIQQAPRQTDLHVVTDSNEGVGYIHLLKNRNFRRFFLAQVVSSLGDWIGVVAIAGFAYDHFGTSGVGYVMTARVLPGFVVGPLAGVLADRWDRKKTMVVADILRALIIVSLPFVQSLPYFLLASAVLESLTLVWGPAKDASLPHFVSPAELTHANSLSLIAIYGPWPLASVAFVGLSSLGAFLGEQPFFPDMLGDSPEALSLWVDGLTFGFSAFMVSRLTIPTTRTRARKLDFSEVRRDLVEGLLFVRDHKQVRPWLVGIAVTFTAAGGVFSLGTEFVRVTLGGGRTGFGFLVGFLGSGMIIGLLASGQLAKRMKRDVLFSAAILLLGVALIGLAVASSLNAAIPIASALGFFGGVGYATGYSLIQITTDDELLGRTFSAAYTLIRIGTLVGLGLFPLIAGAIGQRTFGGMELPGSRVTLLLAGLVVIGGGLLSTRAIKARRFEEPVQWGDRGYFLVFEGGEGAGKSTQMAALVKWLEARGEEVVTTREPGGTTIGERIRKLLLDNEASEMEPRTEALLYAADRAQHVAEVIRPALETGKIVVSDRFVDSSLAYQGMARGLGLDEIYQISSWATGGLIPNLVIYLQVDPHTAMHRVDGERDRIENEDRDFHESVAAAYLQLSKKFPERFIVVDASRSAAEVHQEVVATFTERASGQVESATDTAPIEAAKPPATR